jgi:L-lactate dehydrogenase (cytochrome)
MIRSARKLPSLPYFWSLIDWTLPSLNPYKGKLQRAQNVADLAAIAKKRTPKVVFDYVEGSAVDEVAYDRTRQALARVEILILRQRFLERVLIYQSALRPPAIPV